MLTFSDTAELAAELSAQEGLDLAEAQAVATEHLRRLPHGSGGGPVCHTAIDCPAPPPPRPPARLVPCDPPTEPTPEPTPFPRPFPPAEPFPRQVNWSDRERCSFCCGNHPTDACPLRRPVFVGAAAQEGGLALIVATLESARRELADLRASGLHSAAQSLLGDTLNHIEAWLDPESAAVRQEQLAAGRELVRATLAERVEIDGVAVPF